LSEDEVGLHVEIDPPDTQWARDAMTTIERGDVTQMSFGFYTIKDEWNQNTTPQERGLVEVECFDVSPCTSPAYPDTDVAVRAMESDTGDGDDIGEPDADPSAEGDPGDSESQRDDLSVVRAAIEIKKRRA